MTGGEVIELDNPAKVPDQGKYETIEEPIITATVHLPQEYVGPIMQLCQERRGVQQGLHYDPGGRVRVVYEMPLAEVVFGFYDRLKTMSRGYASLDYEPAGYREADLIRLDVLVNGERVDALSIISHRDTAYHRGVELCTKMKDVVPRQMFDVAIQAAIGSRVIARTTVKAIAQGRHREVLRRRHHAQEEAAREAEGRQEAHEVGRLGRAPAGGVPDRAQGRLRCAPPASIAASARKPTLLVREARAALSLKRGLRGKAGDLETRDRRRRARRSPRKDYDARPRTGCPCSTRSSTSWSSGPPKSTTRDYVESIGAAILIALALRAFVIEAFKIPSSSMYPTLEIGDHIFVNKFIYGVRIPWTNTKLFELREPEARRGDRVHAAVRAGARLHQARRRRSPATPSRSAATSSTSTARPSRASWSRARAASTTTTTRSDEHVVHAAVQPLPRDRRRLRLRHLSRPRAPGARRAARARASRDSGDSRTSRSSTAACRRAARTSRRASAGRAAEPGAGQARRDQARSGRGRVRAAAALRRARRVTCS